MNILIGITSSIASYKIYELIRMFKKQGCNVKTIVTKNALQFVSPLVLETLSGDKCYYEQFNPRNNTEHITLVNWADVFVVAPLSANTLSKFAHGICDNLLTSIFCAYLGSKKPLLLAPAMNENMYNNPLIQNNLEILKEFSEIIAPQKGYLACGAEGVGRLADIEIIFQHTLRNLFQNKENNSKKIIVTLAGTQEMIDNVRCITNLSSGKMGTALCDWAYYMGYEVCAISSIELKKPYKVISIKSAEEMLAAIKKQDFDYLIMASAVCDFKVKNISSEKISKEKIEGDFKLELVKNPDIAKTIAQEKNSNQKVVGFCLADKDHMECARKKLISKNLDYIVVNDVQALNSNENEVTILDKSGKIKIIEKDTKQNVAKKILEVICD
ncbi:bifunctional phosphopantothenoylcysteine decarboxylase/phosphopantothenate--cysteine ligase CoaBC [bacterium]|nr:bifunctional phosphopantothenoylcysteine decarboxylase/phosphopantothenate--cysteine ligase CoaBC [bacterium]